MPVDFETQLRIYPAMLSALKASSEEICVNCIGLEAAKTKVEKGLKKLKMKDIPACPMTPEEKKGELVAKIDGLLAIAEGIPLAESCSCQKTAGVCKLPGCIPKFVAEELPKILTPPT